MKYLITGGTGFIGNELVNGLLKEGAEIIILTRNKNDCNKIFQNRVRAVKTLYEIGLAEKIDCIINLAGEPIANKRWSKTQKQKLLSSRIETTKNLVKFISRFEKKPKCLISASAIGYYGCQGNNILNENSLPVDEFTHELCKAWEEEAKKAEDLGIRICLTRFGVVLGNNGGALQKMLPAFKLGLGGKIGSGKQYFSWIHIDDVISAIRFLIDNKNSKGAYNLSSQNPVTNAEFTRYLASTIDRPAFLNMPSFAVKLIFGEMGDRLLLNGQRVLPEKLSNEGFIFNFSELDKALNDILR